jgi:hypothetical protein
MIGRFYLTKESLAFLETGIASALASRSAPPDPALLATVMEYLDSVLLGVPFRAAMEEQRTWTARYDIDAWRRDGYVKALAEYRLPDAPTHLTTVDPQLRALLENRLATFGEHPAGLGKFTRTMFARDLRRSLVAAAPATALDARAL